MLTRSKSLPMRHLSFPKAVFHRFFQSLELRRQRRRLSLLDDHLLRDIGVTRAEAGAEADQKAWDAPDYWVR